MRRIIIIIILGIIPLLISAQRRQITYNGTSIDIAAGPSTLLLGDIGKPFHEDYLYTRNTFNQPMRANLSVSIGFHQSFAEDWAYKIAVHSGIYDRKDADYAFRSSVFELTGRFEYRLFAAYYTRARSLYLFGGVGLMYSNYVNEKQLVPKEKTTKTNTSPVVPIGIGYKHELFGNLSLGAEFDFHYAFTDMIEGVNGGMPHDAFSTLSLVLSYQISDGNRY